MTTNIISSPVRIFTNPSDGLLNKIQKAGVTFSQLENYINRSYHKRAKGKKNNHKLKNPKNDKKFRKLAEEVWKDVFRDDTSTYVRYY